MVKQNRVAERIQASMTRMRLRPRFYDYCYFLALNNLRVLKKLLERLPAANRLTVVDLGCGSKPFEELFPQGTTYVGIDVSTERGANVIYDFQAGVPISDSSADVVILSEALEHLPDPFLIIGEVKRILKPRGYLFVSTPFALPIHGKPFDFFRFTEFFYRGLQQRFGLEIMCLGTSNSIFVTPLLLLSYILLPVPGVPYFVKQGLSVFVNGVAAFGDGLVNKVIGGRHDTRLSGFSRSFPLGYALLLRSDRQ